MNHTIGESLIYFPFPRPYSGGFERDVWYSGACGVVWLYGISIRQDIFV